MRSEIEAARVERAIRALMGVAAFGTLTLAGMAGYALLRWLS